MNKPYSYYITQFGVSKIAGIKIEKLIKVTGYNKNGKSRADFFRDIIVEPRLKELEELYKL